MSELPDSEAATRTVGVPSAPPVAVSLAGRKLGRYVVGTPIGRGGMGSVWHAHDDVLHRDVALKVLAPHNWQSEEARRRLHSEARAAALLDHPNIAKVYDVDEVDGAPWIAMQYVSGDTLRQIMREGRVRFEQAAIWVATLADALDHAHARGVLHRDISASNVTIDPFNLPVLLDFGLAQTSCAPSPTENGRTMGTIHYLAPELLTGQSPDPRSDIYSLGILLFELLSGTFPFPATEPGRYLISAAKDAPRDVRGLAKGIPEGLARAVMTAIARDPSVRHRNMGDFRDAIAQAVGIVTRPRNRRLKAGPKPRLSGDFEQRYARAVADLERSDQETRIEAAILELEALVSDAPGDSRFAATLALALITRGRLLHEPADLEQARASSKRALELAPDDPLTLTALAEIFRSDGNLESALPLYERALDGAPTLVAAYIGASYAKESRGDRDGAEASARSAIAAAPEDWRGYGRLGGCLYNAGSYARAAEPWRRGLEIAPDNARLCSSYGSTLFHLDMLDDALEFYRRSLNIRPSTHAASNLATALFYLGRPQEAVPVLEQVVALAPDDAVMWGNLGSAARLTPGYEARAAEALDRAIHLMRARLARDETQARDWAWLATWLAARGLAAEARRAVEHAIALAPSDTHCVVIAGTVAEFAANRTEAVKYLQQAARMGYGLARLARDPFLAPLRASPEWSAIEQAAVPPQQLEGGQDAQSSA